nr:zf-CCHC domain-containing protein/UBN2 domain-containing protein [Tanacetum cinerariifolium]
MKITLKRLKALDEGFSSKNYVRKFLMALHPKWRAKVMTIEESKDLPSLALDELISNLKVHEVVMEKDFEIYRGKKERVKSIALKAKKESSDDETSTSRSDNETSTSGSDDEEYAMAVRNFKKFFKRKGKFVRQPREEKKSFKKRDEKKENSDRKCFRCGDLNHLIDDCPKPSRNKDQKAFIGGSWSDSENNAEDKTNEETYLMAQASNEVTLNSCYYSDKASTSETKTMNFGGSSAEKGTDGSIIKVQGSTLPGSMSRTYGEKGTEHVFSLPMSFRSDFVITRKKLIHNSIDESKKLSLKPSPKSDYLTKFDPKSHEGVFLGYSQNSKAYVVLNKHTMKVEELISVTFDESPPPTKLSPLVDDDVGEEEAIRKNTKIVNIYNEEDESIEVDEIVNIREIIH